MKNGGKNKSVAFIILVSVVVPFEGVRPQFCTSFSESIHYNLYFIYLCIHLLNILA